jgi:hypothetical protein
MRPIPAPEEEDGSENVECDQAAQTGQEGWWKEPGCCELGRVSVDSEKDC